MLDSVLRGCGNYFRAGTPNGSFHVKPCAENGTHGLKRVFGNGPV